MEEFNGKGYAKTPISGEEASQFRHLFAAVSSDWGSVRKLVIVIRAIAIVYDVIKYSGPVLVTCAGIGYYLKIQGII